MAKTQSMPAKHHPVSKVGSSVDRISLIISELEHFKDDDSTKNASEVPSMVNEYFNDVRGLSFYMKLRRDQQDVDKQRKLSQSVTKRSYDTSQSASYSKPKPITSMSRHYRQMRKLRAEGKLDHQWVR